MAHAVRNRRVNRVFRDVALDAKVIRARVAILRQHATNLLVLRSCLPCSSDSLSDATHCLRVRRNNRDRAHVVQNILSRNSFCSDPALGKCDVLGKTGVKVMAHHEHVEVLVNCVHRVGPSGVGARRDHVGLRAHAKQIWSVAAACAFRVIRVNRAARKRRHTAFHERGLVQSIAVHCDLHVHPLSDLERGIDNSWSGTPVFMHLQPSGTGTHLCLQLFLTRAVSFPREGQVDRERVGGAQHHFDVLCSGCACGCKRARRRT
mmetsp:Transcript_11414/g.30755  ORF Transcript_11414/g.30755 Transcript_11414/m.30755 type:complete len:262 (+) Transcript_11414:412-1197(+)